MPATPESKVKKAVIQLLDSYGAYRFAPVTGGFGKSGVPDIIACYHGRFIGIECKAGTNTPTALQTRELTRIADAGGVSIVINGNNVNELAQQLEQIKETVSG